MSEVNTKLDQWLAAQSEFLSRLGTNQTSDQPIQWNQLIESTQPELGKNLPKSLDHFFSTIADHATAFNQFAIELIKHPEWSKKENINSFMIAFKFYINQQRSNSLLDQLQISDTVKSLLSAAISHNKTIDLTKLFQHLQPFNLNFSTTELSELLTLAQTSTEQLSNALSKQLSIEDATYQAAYINFEEGIIQSSIHSSLAELHQQWSKIFQPLYNEMLLQDDYQQSRSHVINCTAQCSFILQQYQNHFLKALGIPNQQEHDLIIKKLSQTNKTIRQQHKQIQDQQKAILDLQTELKRLQTPPPSVTEPSESQL